MKTTRLIGAVAAAVFSLTAFAQSGVEAMAKTLKEKYPATAVQEISETQIPGVYQVVMGKNIAYVGQEGRYFIFGHLFDMKTQTDLTAAKLEEVTPKPKVNFADLPKGDAIVTVKGDGSRKLAVFSDPDCPYCKQLEATIDKLENVTVYTYLYPLDGLHPQARGKAISAWCAKDRAQAWKDMMTKGTTPAKAECDNPVERTIAMAQKLGINGTPAIVTPDNNMVPGALPLQQLAALLGKQK